MHSPDVLAWKSSKTLVTQNVICKDEMKISRERVFNIVLMVSMLVILFYVNFCLPRIAVWYEKAIYKDLALPYLTVFSFWYAYSYWLRILLVLLFLGSSITIEFMDKSLYWSRVVHLSLLLINILIGYLCYFGIVLPFLNILPSIQ